MIIKNINDPATRFVTKLMACKLLRKCRKEEAPAGVVAAAAQCAKGTFLSWVSYLLNLFLEDYRDAQDAGTKFHYSWLLILIALDAWEKPKYSMFCGRTGRCGAVRYETLRHNTDAKQRKSNTSIFGMYIQEMQEKIANTWRISPEVVKEHEGIANFKASRHNTWIQARRDPKKTWLKMHYCITTEEVQWVLAEWLDQWKVPVVGKKGEKGKEQAEAATMQKSSSPTTNTRK
jgi:hypothetical protein